jgi:RecJ-like exonuclease
MKNSEKVSYKDKENNTTRLMDAKDGSFFDGIVKINRKAKPGPVVFLVSDGESNIDAVTKDSEFDVDDVVHIMGAVTDRAGRRQIEISRIERSNANFDEIIEKLSIPKRTNFSIESVRYAIMKERFIVIAQRIRKAILDNEPIIIRHHNDADGISSGIALEIACSNMMKTIGVNPEYNLYRSPSRAPFYEVTDVFRDISLSKRITENHGQKKPLIIVADNGSTPEDSFALKILKLLGYNAIVIDHHNPVILTKLGGHKKIGNQGQIFESSVCQYLQFHLNPYLFGLDSQTSAGMLCHEMARMIDETYENKLMPAVAAVADRCHIAESDSYIENSGVSFEELTRIGVAIDFMAYHMKFDISTPIIKELFLKKEFVELINEEVRIGVETQLQSTLPYLRTLDINGVTLSYIDLEKYTLRFTYPSAGKVIGLIHDKISLGKENPVISLGCVSDMIIVRATKPILPVQKIIDTIKEKLPEANADGGGHECAGTIKFVPAHMDAVLQIIKDELHKIQVE